MHIINVNNDSTLNNIETNGFGIVLFKSVNIIGCPRRYAVAFRRTHNALQVTIGWNDNAGFHGIGPCEPEPSWQRQAIDIFRDIDSGLADGTYRITESGYLMDDSVVDEIEGTESTVFDVDTYRIAV